MNYPDLISHLLRDAVAIEYAAAHDDRPSPALMTSAANLMRGAVEALQSKEREIDDIRRRMDEVERLERG